jgi:hypothetical protein
MKSSKTGSGSIEMTARATVHALIFADLSLGVAALPGAAYALDKCICIVSNKLRSGATPVKFQYRSCLQDGSCNKRKSHSFQKLKGVYTAKVICNVSDKFSLFEMRFDWNYKSGFQEKRLIMCRYKTFTLSRDEIPKCDCMPTAQYHFVKSSRGVELHDGPPSDMTKGSSRYNKL